MDGWTERDGGAKDEAGRQRRSRLGRAEGGGLDERVWRPREGAWLRAGSGTKSGLGKPSWETSACSHSISLHRLSFEGNNLKRDKL